MKSTTLPLGGCGQCKQKKTIADSITAAAAAAQKHKRSESLSSRAFPMLSSSGGGNGNSSSSGNSNAGKKDEKDLFKTYIATQGCLPVTITDFWNMIWQENTRVIVMTTKELERGKSKCAKYWPDQGQQREWGTAKLVCLSESSTNDYTLREFLFSWKNRDERRIYQYHFQVWPDHGVPADPGCVLNFLHDVNAKQDQIMQEGITPVKMVASPYDCFCFLIFFLSRKRVQFVYTVRLALVEPEHS